MSTIFNNLTKYLYIHIPFCKKMCLYCDFYKIGYNKNLVDQYIKKIINEIECNYSKNLFDTIYIGGGTPNSLDDKQLFNLLSFLKTKLSKNYEFTIECNPEFLTLSQAKLFKKNKINRISIGVQTLNKQILKDVNRNITRSTIQKAINNCYKAGINNVSCDVIYGFNNLTNIDLKQTLDFLIKNNIKHISCYSLEIKPGTILDKKKYIVKDTDIENNLKFIEKYLKQHEYIRYEVSNWAKTKKYQSKHNLKVWQTNDWAAIGPSGYGFENRTYYHYSNDILDSKIVAEKYSKQDLYRHILLMGLRLKQGINLKIKQNMEAYLHFKNILDKNKLIVIKNKYLKCKNLNLIDNVLIELF